MTPLHDAAVALLQENLTAIADLVAGLGDDLAARRPDLPGANAPYGIANHCVGLVEFWLGSVVGGERIPRDRDGEFTATGRVADVAERLADLSDRVPGWVRIALEEGPRDRTAVGSTRTTAVKESTPEWMLLHVVRELSQHLGQLEITRDLLTTSAGGPA
ncbi:MAG: DUF664 domain-containing protein [Gordonia paraffinivorans]